MTRIGPIGALILLAALVAVLSLPPLWRGALYLDSYEGDMIHLFDLVERVARGQWPHLDFQTPLGYLSIAPISLFRALGAGFGQAFLYAQVAVAAVLLLPVWWVARTRFHGIWGALFAIQVLVFVLALIHGETDPYLAVSMHYNRWAWALAYLAVPLALLPRRGGGPDWPDMAVLGGAMTALALVKITYVAALAPPIAAALLLRGQGRLLAGALAVSAVLLLGFTALAGAAYWPAYLGDLLTVARSEIRQHPDKNLVAVLSAPAYLATSLLVLAGAALLRLGRLLSEGLALLLLLPGLVYVTYQNYGNDPQWLVLVGLILIVLAPRAPAGPPDRRQALSLVAAGILALGAGSFVNLATSPLRLLLEAPQDTVAAFPGLPGPPDVFVSRDQVAGLKVEVPGASLPVARDLPPPAEPAPEPARLNGAPLPDCKIAAGFVGWFQSAARDLVQAGYGGKRIVAADLIGGLWLFDQALPPVPGGAPWYYGGLPGWDRADYLLIPLCPIAEPVRRAWLDELERLQVGPLPEMRRTPLYILVAAGAERSGQGRQPQISQQRAAKGQTHGEVAARPAFPAGGQPPDGG